MNVLVVAYATAIDVTRVRFLGDAQNCSRREPGLLVRVEYPNQPIYSGLQLAFELGSLG
jgi:hypothetical protein